MKRIVCAVLIGVFIVFNIQARGGCCPNPETIERLQELQRCISTIKSKVTSIQITIDDLDVNVSGIDDLEAQISILGEVLCSKIENISVNVDISSVDVQVSGIEDLEILISTNDELILSDIDAQGQILCSKIEDLSDMVSTNDELILSAIENIQISDVDVLISASDALICSKLENVEFTISVNDEAIISTIEDQASITDALVCSKVGNLDDAGSCLETLIDVPDGINNLDLNVIELLKTILLELRGCNGC